MLDKKTQEQLRKQYNPDGSNRREGQLRMLEMLFFFDEFCKKNNLNYWLDGGTLLGAIRHGGFIPWDDDLDVDMPYPDCVKLVKLFSDRQIGDYVLQTHRTDEGYYRFWPVLRDTKSEYLHEDDLYTEKTLKFRGCQIDVFPVVPRYGKNVMKVNLFTKKVVNKLWMEKPQNNSLLVNMAFFMASKLIYPLLRFFGKSKDEHLTFDFGVGFENEDRVKSEIFPLSEVVFEGHVFKAPNNPIAYCKRIYGDNCMEMPTGNQIYNHHVQIDFKNK